MSVITDIVGLLIFL